MMSYKRLAAMIVVATFVMFGLMYLNTYVFGHVLFSQTRMWMALLMGAVMAILMIAFMWEMYPDRRIKIGIVIGSLMVATTSLWLVRSQETVSDVAYMRAMIPHHSIAIMTSERAHIKDPQVRRLADGIIAAQIREIAGMKQMIARLEARPVGAGASNLPSYRDLGVPPPPSSPDGCQHGDKHAGTDPVMSK